MTDDKRDRLYNLLPSIHRIRDLQQGEPLRALMAVLEETLNQVEADMDNLYEDWFIETCSQRLVPYIGDLVGLPGLKRSARFIPAERSWVGNAIAYRRRKGTVAALEKAAWSATGWPTQALEFFRLLSKTQDLKDVRLNRGRVIDIRDQSRLDWLDSPFETQAHGAAIRAVRPERPAPANAFNPIAGKYNIPFLGVFLYRLQSYPMERAAACQAEPGCFTFNSLGADSPLYNQPRTEAGQVQATRPENVPAPITRRLLADALEGFDRAGYFKRPPVIEIFFRYPGNAQFVRLGSEELTVCDLSRWLKPERATSEGNGKTAAIDPETGRLQFLRSPTPSMVQANFSYGFSADIGGGPYQRELAIPGEGDWFAVVSRSFSNPAPDAPSSKERRPAEKFNNLQDALNAWAEYLEGLPPECYPPLSQSPPRGIVLIRDSDSYEGGRELGEFPWPTYDVRFPKQGRLVIEAETGQFPTLLAGLSVKAEERVQLSLNGLRLAKPVRLSGPITLRVEHCTIAPPIRGRCDFPALAADLSAEAPPEVAIARSILGPMALPSDGVSLFLADSIVDASGRVALAALQGGFGPTTNIERVTVFGSMLVEHLPLASESIFMEPLEVRVRDTGCVRYSYLATGSRTPPRYSCQPDLALEKNGQDREAVRLRVRPTFTSRRYADGGYAQLSLDASPLILHGAEDDGQMGAFNLVRQEIREALLQTVFKEYVPVGLEPQIFFAT